MSFFDNILNVMNLNSDDYEDDDYMDDDYEEEEETPKKRLFSRSKVSEEEEVEKTCMQKPELSWLLFQVLTTVNSSESEKTHSISALAVVQTSLSLH